MEKTVKARVLEDFTNQWWRLVVDHRDAIRPMDWLVVIGTMIGMLADSVSETEEDAAAATEVFNKTVADVSYRFLDTSINQSSLH